MLLALVVDASFARTFHATILVNSAILRGYFSVVRGCHSVPVAAISSYRTLRASLGDGPGDSGGRRLHGDSDCLLGSRSTKFRGRSILSCRCVLPNERLLSVGID